MIWGYLALLMAQAQEVATPPDLRSIGDHHLAGYLLILGALFLYLEHGKLAHFKLVRVLWPFTLLGLGVFLVLFRDMEAPWLHSILVGRFDSLAVQHKLLEMVAILIGIIELFRRTGWLKHRAWAVFLSTLIFAAGFALLLITGPTSHMVRLQHRWMGIVVIALSLAKMGADFKPKEDWLARYAVPMLILTLGLQFVLYAE